MNIEILPTKGNRLLVTWIALALITLVLLMLIHLLFYFLFYFNKASLYEHFADVSVTILFYAIIWPGAIVHSYKSKRLLVDHNGEVDPMLVKNYFLQQGYTEQASGNNFCKLASSKRFDRLFKGSKSVTVRYSLTSIDIELPANKVYDVHHAFKFQSIFVR